MTREKKYSTFFKHNGHYESSPRTKIYGEYILKKNKGLISKETNFETYCKQLINKANAEINR